MAANKTIGGINVTITATTEKFAKGINQARSLTAKFTKSVGGLVFSLKGLGAALAIGSIGKFIANQFEAISALKDLSDKTGVSTEKLAGLQLAAEEAGIATGTLERALVKLNNETGVRGDLALRNWIEKTSKLTTQQEKLAEATKLFGSRGADMVRFLNGGTEAIDEAQIAAEKLGLTVSNEMADKVDKAAESFERFKKSITGTFRQLAVDVAPFVESLSVSLAELTKQLVEVAKGFANIQLVRDKNGNIQSYNTYGPTPGSLSFAAPPPSSDWAAFARTPHTQSEINAFKMQRMLAGDFSQDDLVQRALMEHRSAMDTEIRQGFVSGLLKSAGERLGSAWRSGSGMYDKARAGMSSTEENYAKKTMLQFKSAFTPLADKLGSVARGADRSLFNTRLGGMNAQDLAAGAMNWRWMLGGKVADAVGGLGIENWKKDDPTKRRSMGDRPALSFAESGSVESYRQQAAIRRQSENIAKKQLNVQEQIRDGIDGLAGLLNFPVANLGKG